MKLTNFTDYSLRALIYVATHPDRLCTVREISDIFDTSYNHMVKVVHALSKLGYLDAKKGKGGGILLAKPAADINLADVVIALEPDLNVVECFSADGSCIITSICGLKHVFDDARNAFVMELRKYSLADVIWNKDALLNQFSNVAPEFQNE